MGDIKRKRKKYIRPKKPFDRRRMDEENVLVQKYGLKNKREIWKATLAVSKLRRRAKRLISADEETKKQFLEKLGLMGIAVKDLADVLALTEENLFNRRLQTVLVNKKMANTPKQARQLIVHKHVIVNGTVVNSPSFHVTQALENNISVKPKKPKAKKIEEQSESAPAPEAAAQADSDQEVKAPEVAAQ